ncbi:MAG: hypothetical protein UMR38_05280 [Candidatus Izemoplasma sp.]|nr:hypothetical protein [Candidatus Izemoplasma sp.]
MLEVFDNLLSKMLSQGFSEDAKEVMNYYRVLESHYENLTNDRAKPEDVKQLNLKNNFLFSVKYALYRSVDRATDVFENDIEENTIYKDGNNKYTVYTNDNYIYYQEVNEYESENMTTIQVLRALDKEDGVVLDYTVINLNEDGYMIYFYGYNGTQYERISSHHRDERTIDSESFPSQTNFNYQVYNKSTDKYHQELFAIEEDVVGDYILDRLEYREYDFKNNNLFTVSRRGSLYKEYEYGKLSDNATSIVQRVGQHANLQDRGYGPKQYLLIYAAKDLEGFSYAQYTANKMELFNSDDEAITELQGYYQLKSYNYYKYIMENAKDLTNSEFQTIDNVLEYNTYTLQELSTLESDAISALDNSYIGESAIYINGEEYLINDDINTYLSYMPDKVVDVYQEIIE